MNDAKVTVSGYNGQRKDGHLTGEETERSTHFAYPAGTPVKIVRDVWTPVYDVMNCDNEEISSHQKVGDGKVNNEERMDLIVILTQASGEEYYKVAKSGQNGDHPYRHPKYNAS